MTKASPYKLLLAALFSGCFFMYGCENDINEVRELGSKKIGVDEGKKIDTYLSLNGRMKAHLTAPTLLRYNGDSANKAEFPNSLHVDFFNDSNKIESQLRADYGRYNADEKKVYLRDNVVAFNIQGDTLYCLDLLWDQNTGRFHTDKKVIWSKSHRSNLFIGLNGMDADQSFTDIKLYKMQQGSFFTMPDSTVSSTSDTTVKPK